MLQLSAFPQSGLGPFSLLTSDDAPDLDAPYILLPLGVDVDQPTALVDPPDGDTLLLWVTATRRGQVPPRPYIAAARAEHLEAGAGDIQPALQPQFPWEGMGLSHPSVVRRGGQLLLFYQGAGGLGVASAGSPDGPWSRAAAPILPAALLPGPADSLSVIWPEDDDTMRLFGLLQDGATLLLAECPGAAATAFLAGGGTPTWRVSALDLHPADFPVPLSLTSGTSAPAYRLADLSARRVITPAGRARYDLFLVAAAPDNGMDKLVATAAASYDGAHFLALQTPFLGSARLGGLPGGAAVLSYRQRALLLLGLHGAQTGIAAGLIP